MKKLKLDLDGLQVQTFTTEPQPKSRGTVRGFDSTSGGPWGCQDACMSGEYCNSASGCDTHELACMGTQTEISCPQLACG
jgi:hypothetical protein